MPITNPQSGTRIDELADDIYRIITPAATQGGDFSFNQYLIVDDEPLLFHTGPRKMFPVVREAITSVLNPSHTVRRHDTPHLPHAWGCGFLMEERTRTLRCGDLFTQGGADNPPLTKAEILGPSEAFRHQMDYFSHCPNARQMLEKLATAGPSTPACMHGSAWQGGGGQLLRALADVLSAGSAGLSLRPA